MEKQFNIEQNLYLLICRLMYRWVNVLIFIHEECIYGKTLKFCPHTQNLLHNSIIAFHPYNQYIDLKSVNVVTPRFTMNAESTNRNINQGTYSFLFNIKTV